MVPIPDRIRIFPLTEVVLFPDTLLPLHIFEPRYREMLADALDGDRVIGMTLLKAAGTIGAAGTSGGAAAGEAPPVFLTGCAGRVAEHETFADGRSLIILQGTVKFRIHEELAVDKPYRMVKAQALYEAPPLIEDVRRWSKELEQALDHFVDAARGSGSSEALREAKTSIDSATAVNYLSAALPFSAIEKQSLLECPTVESRYLRLRTMIDFKAAELRLGIDGAVGSGN